MHFKKKHGIKFLKYIKQIGWGQINFKSYFQYKSNDRFIRQFLKGKDILLIYFDRFCFQVSQ